MGVLTDVRLLGGGLLLLAPQAVLQRLLHQRATPTQRRVLRVLGVRHLLQALTLWRWPTPRLLRGGAAIDGVHASTMVLLGTLKPQQRTLALTDAAAETLLLAADLCQAHLMSQRCAQPRSRAMVRPRARSR